MIINDYLGIILYDNALLDDKLSIINSDIKEMGKLTEDKKSKFFTELTKTINNENTSLGSSYDETFGNKKSSDDNEESEDDFSDLLGDKDLD